MDYSFRGNFSYKNFLIPFELQDGRVRLNVSNLPIKEVCFVDTNGNEFYSTNSRFQVEYLEGTTDDDRIIKIHAHGYYDGNIDFDSSHKYIYGTVISCAVFDKTKYKGKVDKIGFYSYEIHKITGHTVSGAMNDEVFKMLGVNTSLASYVENNNTYRVSFDFVNRKPYFSGQVIAISSVNDFTLEMMEDTFWTMRKFFAFVYQRKEVPMLDVILFDNNEAIGNLFIQKFKDENKIDFSVKCLQIGFWGDKLSKLFQALVDRKIYLRHLPSFEGEKNVYTPNRFLTTVVGLESTLNTLGIKAAYSKEHLNAISDVKKQIEELVNSTSGKIKKEYKRLLGSLEDERFEDKALTALNENKQFIKNFYNLDLIGDSNAEIANDLSKSRNRFAHGHLEEDLTNKHADQCDFLDLFILYLQLLYIGFDKQEACQTVPGVMFKH